MASLEETQIQRLRGSDNYSIWTIRAKAVLAKEELIDTIRQSATTGSKNDRALSIIQLLCDDGPLLYIKDITDAKQAWDKLQEIYYPKGFTTQYLTLKEFFNAQLDDFHTIEEYLNRVKMLVDDLTSKGIILPKQVVIAWVLNSLSEEYESLVQSIIHSLQRDPNSYTPETLFSSLIKRI